MKKLWTLIPYRTIVSNVLETYIAQNESSFKLQEDGSYLCCSSIKTNKINKLLLDICNNIYQDHQDHSRFIAIINTCYLSNHYSNVISIDNDDSIDMKYILKEYNIKIDIHKLNNIFETFFNKHFKKQTLHNILFIKNKHLTDYNIIDIFKNKYPSDMLDIDEIDEEKIFVKYSHEIENKKDVPMKFICNVNEYIEQFIYQ